MFGKRKKILETPPTSEYRGAKNGLGREEPKVGMAWLGGRGRQDAQQIKKINKKGGRKFPLLHNETLPAEVCKRLKVVCVVKERGIKAL